MREGESQLSAFVLAQIEWELEGISRKQHELARRKTLLRERATRLRLGASPAELNLTASPPLLSTWPRGERLARGRPVVAIVNRHGS